MCFNFIPKFHYQLVSQFIFVKFNINTSLHFSQ